MIRFDGRVAVVTGGGNGLGREYCMELAWRGARVVVNDLGGSGAGVGSSQAPAQQVADEITAAGGMAIANFDTVATRAGGAAIIEAALDHFGRLDILISNAGFLRNSRFDDLTDEQIDAVRDVHLMAGFYVGQPAFRAMKKNGYGRILFTASASGLYGHPWQANYAAAKAGLVGLANVVALEGLRFGINANALLPTAMTRLANEMDQGFLEVTSVAETVGKIDFGRTMSRMTPAHNVPLALYLVSERCTETHGVFSAICGRYARVIIGVGEGYLHPTEDVPSIETLAEHWGKVADDMQVFRPDSVYDEMYSVYRRLT